MRAVAKKNPRQLILLIGSISSRSLLLRLLFHMLALSEKIGGREILSLLFFNDGVGKLSKADQPLGAYLILMRCLT